MHGMLKPLNDFRLKGALIYWQSLNLESGEFAMSSWVARERIPPLAGCSLARQRSAFSIAPR